MKKRESPRYFADHGREQYFIDAIPAFLGPPMAAPGRAKNLGNSRVPAFPLFLTLAGRKRARGTSGMTKRESPRDFADHGREHQFIEAIPACLGAPMAAPGRANKIGNSRIPAFRFSGH